MSDDPSLRLTNELIAFFKMLCATPERIRDSNSNVRQLCGLEDKPLEWRRLANLINALPGIKERALHVAPVTMESAYSVAQIIARLKPTGSGRASRTFSDEDHRGVPPGNESLGWSTRGGGPRVRGGQSSPPGRITTRISRPSDSTSREGGATRGGGRRDGESPSLHGTSAEERAPPSRKLKATEESTTARNDGPAAERAVSKPRNIVLGSSDPNTPPSFFFSLEGEGAARADEALWGKSFDLVFNYGRVSAGALAIIKETKLERVKKGQVALGVEIVPKGLTLTKGSAFRLVRFKDGRMIGDPPRFSLSAPQQDDAEPAPHGVYVTFTIAGSVVYSFFLDIQLVEKFSDNPRAIHTIELDLEDLRTSKGVEPRTAWLTIRKKGGPWEIFGGIFGADDDLLPDVTTVINETSLDAAYRDSILDDIKTIAGETAWRFVDDQFDVPAEQHAAALACMQKAMTVGYKLYRRFSEDPVFKKAIDLIESLSDGSKITIKTDREAFPWELIYPLHYIDGDRPKNFQPSRFWGHRFEFESLLLPTSDGEKIPSRRQQRGKLHVSMGLNSSIDTEPPWVGRTPLPVQLQRSFFDAALKDHGAYFDGYNDILNIVLKPDPASLIYFFCHGTAKALQFDKTKPKLTADNVEGGPNFPSWPIVFVNACDAGNISPLSFYSFRTEFRKRRAAGLIAPSFPVPTMFAAMFGNAFLTSYSKRQPVGKILLNLRRELLAKNNPLGLWYSLQCPLDVKAPER